MCLFLCYSCIITNLKAGITDAFATIIEDMLGNTWREIDYQLDVLRATKRAHVEVYWCVVKKNLLSYISKKKKCLYSMYSSFVVINVCNQGKTLCLPCISEHRKWIINFRTLKMIVASSLEMRAIIYQSTRRHKPKHNHITDHPESLQPGAVLLLLSNLKYFDRSESFARTKKYSWYAPSSNSYCFYCLGSE